jgi:ABC-type amino acid transport substrate-binding protein
MHTSIMKLLLLFLMFTTAAWAAPEASESGGREAFSLQVGMRPWKGDFDAMVQRRLIRVLVPYSKTFYYVEKGRARGVSYDILNAFEQDLNRKLKTRHLKVKVVFVPAGREELIPWLQEGRGDLIVADLSITAEKQKLVDFSDPMFTGIREIPVTGPGGPEVGTIDDLSGKEVFVRRTSSYYEHLKALNERFAREGKAPVKVREAAEDLEAEDILEMGRVGMWRGGHRSGISVAASFVWRCLTSLTIAPFPHPAHRTERALLTHQM